jgi:FkbM family methyltransferase
VIDRGELQPPPRWLRAAAVVVRALPAGRYRASALLSRSRRPPFRARMPAASGGASFHCDLRDEIAREVFFTGSYGPAETALLRAVLRPGATCVDVGANWGYFTLLAAHLVGPGGRVVALEPDPRVAARLRANVQANALGHVAVRQLAASDGDGTARLSGYDEDGSNWGLSSLASTVGPRSFDVDTRPLDDVLDDTAAGDVDLVKIDVEGAELHVLRGMRRGLAAGRYRAVLLELHPTILDTAALREATRTLTDAGFTAWRLDHHPAAVRRAAYARDVDVSELLQPPADDDADPWPHLYLAREGGWRPA